MRASRVLVVDDEPILTRSLSFVLSKEGFEVSTAADGEEALAKITGLAPDLVVLDVMMPKVNGYDVCQRVRGNPRSKHMKVIMLSAKGQEADRVRGMAVGADDFLTKPFSPLALVARIRELLAGLPEVEERDADAR